MLLATETIEFDEVAETEVSSPPDASSAFLADCLTGLGATPKTLPCKWLYDAEGSRLFEAICDTPEYYPSRTEAALLARAAPEIAAMLEPATVLVEFGSGASRKTRTLLDAAPRIETYVAIDICRDELARSCAAIRADYPDLRVVPLHGDFTAPLTLEPELRRRPLVGFFPGSTLGNFTPEQAIAFLRSGRKLLGAGACLLLGVDMRKDATTLTAAYDDAGGVTAAFNLNLLARMKRELDCTIDTEAFAHRAIWNAADGRIEMHLASRRDQRMVIGGRGFDMAAGETIHTESCHKFTLNGLKGLAARSGWTIRHVWMSDAPRYSLLLLDAT